MIGTLVVDDDFRVASVHAEYVRRVPGFTVSGVAHSLAEARTAMAGQRPDLLLLDLYLPDGSGLELLQETGGDLATRTHTIVITAARDVESVRAAMIGGAVSYLVKPFRRAQLVERLEALRDLSEHLAGISQVSQVDVDRAYGMLHPPKPPRRLPKGITAPTLRVVGEALARHPQGVTSAQLAQEVDVSRATLQRYLSFLADAGEAELTMQYGEPGRPVHVFRPC